jgi:molybdopterin converting factor small subunit
MKVKIIAPFEIKGLDQDDCLEALPGTSLRDLMRQAKAPLVWRGLPVSVNGMQVSKSHILSDGDVIVFIYPLSGG